MRSSWLGSSVTLLAVGLSVAAQAADAPAAPAVTPPVPPKVQTAPVQVPTVKPRLDEMKEWGPFWNEFRRAVARRNANAIRSAMSDGFVYDFARQGRGDTRRGAVERLQKGKAGNWSTLTTVASKGFKPDPYVKGVVVAPPEWITKRAYRDWRIGFAKDVETGYWRWIYFVNGA